MKNLSAGVIQVEKPSSGISKSSGLWERTMNPDSAPRRARAGAADNSRKSLRRDSVMLLASKIDLYGFHTTVLNLHDTRFGPAVLAHGDVVRPGRQGELRRRHLVLQL